MGSHTDRVTGHNDCLFPQNEDYKLTFTSLGRKLSHSSAGRGISSDNTVKNVEAVAQLPSKLVSCPLPSLVGEEGT